MFLSSPVTLLMIYTETHFQKLSSSLCLILQFSKFYKYAKYLHLQSAQLNKLREQEKSFALLVRNVKPTDHVKAAYMSPDFMCLYLKRKCNQLKGNWKICKKIRSSLLLMRKILYILLSIGHEWLIILKSKASPGPIHILATEETFCGKKAIITIG